MYRPSKLDDHIVLLRAIAGVMYALIAYIIYRLGFKLPYMNLGLTIWFLAGVAYVFTAYYIQKTLGVSDFFHLFIRGLLTFYGTWILLFLILYDLLG